MHALGMRSPPLTLLDLAPVQCTVPNTGCATKNTDGCSCKACSSGYMPDGIGGCKQVTLKAGSEALAGCLWEDQQRLNLGLPLPPCRSARPSPTASPSHTQQLTARAPSAMPVRVCHLLYWALTADWTVLHGCPTDTLLRPCSASHCTAQDMAAAALDLPAPPTSRPTPATAAAATSPAPAAGCVSPACAAAQQVRRAVAGWLASAR